MNKGKHSISALEMGRHLERSMSFGEYSELVDRLVEEGRTTGPLQTEKLADFTKLNRQRMKRIGKTFDLPGWSKNEISKAKPSIWLVITEAWCGDAAQVVPVIEAAAAASNALVTRYLLRDEHPALIDRFLTNGGRSIPKLISLDPETLEVQWDWGPRPKAAQNLFSELDLKGIDRPKVTEELQKWYNADKQNSILTELLVLARGNQGISAVESETAKAQIN
jgi:hypothetical protein